MFTLISFAILIAISHSHKVKVAVDKRSPEYLSFNIGLGEDPNFATTNQLPPLSLGATSEQRALPPCEEQFPS